MLAQFLELSVAEIMLAILVLFVVQLSCFGSEWVFGRVENKTLALRDRHTSAVILVVLATYFHFLRGFWALSQSSS